MLIILYSCYEIYKLYVYVVVMFGFVHFCSVLRVLFFFFFFRCLCLEWIAYNVYQKVYCGTRIIFQLFLLYVSELMMLKNYFDWFFASKKKGFIYFSKMNFKKCICSWVS